MTPLISIVTAYHNRKTQFIATLKSIQYFDTAKNVEVIAVDDASTENQRIEDLTTQFPFLQVVRVEPSQKHWTNPCIPYNTGFRRIKGKITIIQNPECLHVGNILDYVTAHLQKHDYFSFACYSTDKVTTTEIQQLNPFDIMQKVNTLYQGGIWQEGMNGWYNHSQYRPTYFHFCAALTTESLLALNGFDERFKNGYGFDDNEFITRLERLPLQKHIIDTPFCVHQYHESIHHRPANWAHGWNINAQLLTQVQKENNYKAVKGIN